MGLRRELKGFKCKFFCAQDIAFDLLSLVGGPQHWLGTSLFLCTFWPTVGQIPGFDLNHCSIMPPNLHHCFSKGNLQYLVEARWRTKTGFRVQRECSVIHPSYGILFQINMKAIFIHHENSYFLFRGKCIFKFHFETEVEMKMQSLSQWYKLPDALGSNN